MPQGDTLTVTDPATPVEAIFALRYRKGDVERLPNPGDFAAVRFGVMGSGPDGQTVERADAEVAQPVFVLVATDDQAVKATYTIGRAVFDATANRRVMLYCQYCRADGTPATPENERILLGYVSWVPGAAPPSGPAPPPSSPSAPPTSAGTP